MSENEKNPDPTGPYCVHEHKGKKAYCTCNWSTTMPTCDGAHKGTGDSPCIVDVPEERDALVCRCGYSKTFPYCDGTHAKITSSAGPEQ